MKTIVIISCENCNHSSKMDSIIPVYQQYFNNENYQFEYFTYKEKFKNNNEYPMVLGNIPACQNIIICNSDVWQRILESDSSALDQLKLFYGKYSDGKFVDFPFLVNPNGNLYCLEDVKRWISRVDNNN